MLTSKLILFFKYLHSKWTYFRNISRTIFHLNEQKNKNGKHAYAKFETQI